MPIHSAELPSGKEGFEWGEHGKVYPTRAQAEKQAAAAHANGFQGDDLEKSSSQAALSHNIATEINHGHPPKQAEAIAYSVKRESDTGEYSPSVAETIPVGLTPAEINDCNRKRWER